MGERTVTIDADVIQADGGTRVASICGGFVALNDLFNKMVIEKELEENPIIEPIGAISAGIMNGEILVDLCYEEDSTTDVDSNIVMTKSGKIIEIQGTAEGDPFTKEEFDTLFYLAKKSIQKIIAMY